jgi:Domain of unknown function (DUF4397)
MSKWCQFAMVTGLAVLLAATAVPARAGSPGPSARLVIIQAVPKQALDVTIDGRTVRRATAVGDVLGPFTVSPGRHRIGFADASGGVRLTSIVDVAAGSSRDIVVHLPASVGGDPVVNDYATPRRTISPGMARVLIAHTATVAPADVRVDGKVVFRNIANGEYATADLAAGEHSVALLPAGLTHDPILGPLQVDLQEGTVTMVYAVGSPREHSMNVIAHTARVASNGAVVPGSIDTGQASFAAGIAVHTFGPSAHGRDHDASSSSGPASWWEWGGILVAALGAAMVQLRRRGLPSRSA